ncbi:HAMP domain-containing protein [Herbaspirillum lusitanum]|uniref:ATP-binding protein n=1 Tax=Herbaspirillum lusitanum TaxID=213312 RepID=UPI002237B936|nr:ATP-binding protein [Herbaspirillum lusitanum]MCW5297467.1 HAMP domain-containing protein [Herbaspirillum lusitanum]
MLRNLVRLYLVIAALVVASILVVNYGFPHLFAGQFAKAVRAGFNGESFMLNRLLSGRSQADQEALLAQLRAAAPERYSRPVQTLEQLPPSVREQLAQYPVGWELTGSKCCVVYVRLDDGGLVRVQSLEELPMVEVVAYVLVFSTILAAVCIWLIPHWRDLEKLRLAAARFGGGRLDARVGLSGRSSIRQLSSHFDRMADRIGKLIHAQRDMVNAVSHELRTPLSRLEFGLDILQHHAQDAATENRILGLRKDVEELEALVAELLTLGMLEHDRQGVFTETVALPEFLRDTCGVTAEALALGKLELRCSVDAQLATVVTEARTLARAYSNLVRNAAQHANSVIRIRAEMAAPDAWTLVVEDDGAGIPEAERERVFESFYRLDQSRDRATGGYGLGLSIVKKIVARHGGSISVGGSELGGAMFIMRLPLRQLPP